MQQDFDINKISKLIYDLSDVILRNNGFIVHREDVCKDFIIEYKTNNNSYSLKVHVGNYSMYEYYFSISMFDEKMLNTTFLIKLHIGVHETVVRTTTTSDVDISYKDFIKEPVFFIKNIIEMFISNFNNYIIKDIIAYRIMNSAFVIRNEKIKDLIKD